MENTISVKEFKAWLEGFEESFNNYHPYPTQEQWKKIREKISTIEDDPFNNTPWTGTRWADYVPPNRLGGIGTPFKPGDSLYQQDVKTSIKEAPVAPGYI